jgi:DNA polymerase-1
MHEGKEVLVNSAAYGYDNAMEHINKVMADLHLTPRQLIFVEEGKDSKRDRLAIHPNYKAGRDKVPEQYVEFNLAKEMLLTAFLSVGAQSVKQDGGVEADDVLGYLAQNLKGERWVISGDKDLAQIVGGDIHHYRAGKIDENPFGDFPHRFIPVYIALVGDSGDKIPGAKGFGDKAFQLMHMAFGNDGLELMEDLIKRKKLLDLEEDVGSLRELQRIIDDMDGVYMSYELGRLRTERVNTMKRPLQWRVGMVKPREQCEEQSLRKHAGVNRIVSAENYDEAMAWAKGQIDLSPEVSLDIETSTPPESDEWLESRDKADRVDVFGSELTSLQMTFGPSMNYTFYLPHNNVEEPGCTNLSMEQIAAFVDLVPRTKIMLIQNVAFELPICYMSWGEMWKDDPEYHGFLRNCRDTKIMSSYVDENRPAGLKDNSKLLLGYDQVNYATVTTKDYQKSQWNGKGKVLGEWTDMLTSDGEVPIDEDHQGTHWVKVQHKMNEMTAREVVGYGCDDTICTAAIGNHFRVVMELENTWDVFEEVETFPAYLTALAYVQGTNFSLESMAAQEKDDDKVYDAAWPILRDYLMKIGFEGTRYEPITALDPASIKRAAFEVDSIVLKTMVRTPSKLAKLIEIENPESVLPLLINEGKIAEINELMLGNFSGEPQLDLASPKQMKTLLYGFMNIPVKVINDVTDNEKANNPALFQAVRKFKQIRAGKSEQTMTTEEMELMKHKAKSDDTAIDFAIAFDTDVLDDEARAALKAIGVMKKVMTRRSLFYKNYWKGLHWKDRKLHCNANQCAAVTRRYSMSDQNLQQLPKKGEAVRFREHFEPHEKNAVIASIDYTGQELRLAAEVSQDKNMLACYVGEKLKDIHSITAAGAMKLKWGSTLVDELFKTHGADLSRDTEGTYTLFVKIHKTLGKEDPLTKKADDLRKDSKNINFGAQNGAKAVKLSETLVMPVVDAQLFLDARSAMFPDVDVVAEEIADEAKRVGYATTMMGARRHLAEAIMSDERGAADRAARQSWNYRIQGSAGEMTKLGMGRLWKSGIYFRYNARFIAPIHDELVSSVHRDHAVEFLREKNACMTQPYSTMKVPILASISLGPNFAQQYECGDWFIKDRIEKALNDSFAMREAA